ncbi:MAG: hypothetical protein SVU32_01850 [Candidatus Nanohaloarchaea archaeon]|nr:hypothetical protein [Candidatus Nanohaloarchaea archaeon]
MLTATDRKGQTVGVDFSIGMAIFVITVAAAIFYTNSLLMPSSPFSAQVQRSAQQATDEFFDTASWQLQQTPVMLNTSRSGENYPVEIPFLLHKTDPDSVLVMHGRKELASQYSHATNQTIFIARLDTPNMYRIIHTSTDVPDRTYPRQVHHSGTTVWNDMTNLTLHSSGIDSLLFDGSQRMVRDASLNISDPARFHSQGPVRVLVRYNATETLDLRMFGQTNRIRILHSANGRQTYRFNLSSSFDWLHTSSGTRSLSGTGIHFQGQTSVIDLTYNDTVPTYGLAIVGQDMNGYVRRNSTGAINLNITMDGSSKQLLLLPHTGGHTNITDEQQLFLNPPIVLSLPTQTRTGLSRQELDRLDQLQEDEIQQRFALEGLGFNISVNTTFNAGDMIPDAEEVAVFSHPAPLLDRFGNTSLQQFRMAVWLR